MRVLITGSQGTLGTPLIRELRRRGGYDAYGMDLTHHADEKEIRGDVREARQVDGIFAATQPELVVHLAAEFGRINGSLYHEDLWTTNCLGTANVIRACVSHNAHLVMASSSEAYGDGADIPGLITEDRMLTHVPHFSNEYALTKWTNEKQVEIASTYHGLHATILRFFNVYGPGEHYSPYRSVVCQFIYRMLHHQPFTVYKGGWRDFLYIGDWVQMLIRVIERHGELDGEVLNIAGCHYESIENLVEILSKKLDYAGPVDYRGPERANVKHKEPSNARALIRLDYECQWTLDEGLERTIKWQQETYGK